MLTQAGSTTPAEDVLRQMLLALARQMASTRGQDSSCIKAGQLVSGDLQGIDLSEMDVTLLGDVYTALMPDRHRRGCYYTPDKLAECVARQVIPHASPLPRILDPAMGSGHFLLAAARVIAEQIRERDPEQSTAQVQWAAVQCLHGVDSDPMAVELAAISLWLWAACPGTIPAMLSGRLVRGDALLDDLWKGELAPPFDVVVGNPPYASAITRARGTSPATRSALSSRYQTARGSFDLCVPFVERAVKLCKQGGRCGLVVPNKLLSADYARPLRDWLARQVSVEAIFDASRQNPFTASVYPAAVILRSLPPFPQDELAICRWTNGETQPAPKPLRRATQADLHAAPGQSWSAVLDPDWDMLRRCWEEAIPLSELATLAGGLTVSEAYALRPAVFDAPEEDLPQDTFRLLTSGLIRHHTTNWGQRPARYLKTTYQRAAIGAGALSPHRRSQAAAHKIIVAGMGKTPRAVVDYGQAQASVSTTIILDAQWPPGALCAVLNSRLMGRVCQAIFGGLALGGGHMRFGKPELAHIPLPDIDVSDPRLARLDVLAGQRALASAAEEVEPVEAKIEALVYNLYRLDKNSPI